MTGKGFKNGGKTKPAPDASADPVADLPEAERARLFKAGGPGGPGRPKGARSKVARMLDDLATEDARTIGDALLTLAKAGDMAAMRLVVDRIWPVSKGRAVEVDLPAMTTADDLARGVGAIVAAVAAGELTTEEGRDLGAMLETQRRAIDTTELERRITELEQRTANK
jgi:hypothetical protein